MSHLHPSIQMEGPTALAYELPLAMLENHVSQWQMLQPRDRKLWHSLKWIMQPEEKWSICNSGTLTSHSQANTTAPLPQTVSPMANTYLVEAMKWKQMWEFHSTTNWQSIFNLWPNHTQLPGVSVLEWMMLQPNLDKSWHHTYSWTEELDLFQKPMYIIPMAL